jgi:hypothetical protein
MIAIEERRFSFGVSYPIIKRSDSPGEPPGGKEAGMSVKVLLIDDDQDFRVSVRSLLDTRGYEVLEAGSGHEGIPKPLDIPSLLDLPEKAGGGAGRVP